MLEALLPPNVYLRNEKMFAPEDDLFSKPEQRLVNGKYVFDKLPCDFYSSGSKVNAVFRKKFEQVQMHPYHPHSIRKTLGRS